MVGHEEWKIIQIISFEIQKFYVFSETDEKEIQIIHWFSQRKIGIFGEETIFRALCCEQFVGN